MSDPLWHLDSVTLAGTDRPRLNGITLSLRPGVTAIMGWSGAGKTSLLNLLVGFERPTSGRLISTLTNDAASSGRLPLFWVPPDGGLWPHLTAREHLAAASPGTPDPSTPTIQKLFEQFDLADVAGARPARLSQGERSRLSVARAMATQAGVLVMDEPLAHVDPARAGRYRDVITTHCRTHGTSLIFSSHVPDFVLAAADRVVCLSAGTLAWEGPVDDLYHRPPNAELATFLGPSNWVTASESALWFGASALDRCLRPESITIESTAGGPFEVIASEPRGPVTATELSHPAGARRRWVHTSKAQLSRGERVILVMSG